MTGSSLRRLSQHARRPGANVLIVDDDDDSREAIARLLKYAGYVVECCANGVEAVKLLQQEDRAAPDVILLDIMMPGMDGIAFRAEQKKMASCARVPVVIVSAQGDLRNTVDADAYLDKPLEYVSLVDTIDRMVDLHTENTPARAVESQPRP